MAIKLILVKTEGTGFVPPVMIRTLGAGGSQNGTHIGLDSSGNYYVSGSTSSGMVVAKYDSSNVLQWSRNVSYPSASIWYNGGLVIDGNDTSIVSFTGLRSYSPYGEFHMLRFDPADGTTEDVIQIGNFGGETNYAFGKDSSDNLYMFGIQTNGRGIVIKYDTSFTLQWQRQFTVFNSGLVGGCVDPAGNSYGIGRYYNPNNTANVTKWDASGVVQWQRQIGDATSAVDNTPATTAHGTDGTDIYVTVATNGGYGFVVMKINANGTEAWQRDVSYGANLVAPTEITYDAGHIYIAGWSLDDVTGNYIGFVMKYTTAGVLVWQRFLDGDDPDVEQVWQVGFTASGDLMLVGTTASVGAGGNDILIATFPADGSDTGTHGPFTWTAGSFVDASSSIPFATATVFSTEPGNLTQVVTPESTNNPVTLTDTQQAP